MVGRMWRHLEYVRSQRLQPDARMYAFVISTCATAEPPSARNAFVAMKCLADMQARRSSRSAHTHNDLRHNVHGILARRAPMP
jgi:hypothetical protein